MIRVFIAVFLFITSNPLFSQEPKRSFPEELITRAEKTEYSVTSLYADVLAFCQKLDEVSDIVSVEYFATSTMGKKLPLVVIADPPVANAEEAYASGLPVILLLANIHGGEVEGKEASMELMRDIVLGGKRELVKNQILLFIPIYNADGNDKLSDRNRRSQEGSPMVTGERANGQGLDLNRDAVKTQSPEMSGLLENVLLTYDPFLLVDLHTTNGSWHGYSLTYAGPYTPTGAQGPQGYVFDTMLPELRENVRENKGVETFMYGGFSSRENWPPTEWNYGGYSANAWFLVNYMGMRNRMAILSETFAHDSFQKRIHSAKSFSEEIIAYTNQNGRAMLALCKEADKEVSQAAQKGAERGVEFDVTHFEEPVDILVYDHYETMDSVSIYNSQTGTRERKLSTVFKHHDEIIEVKNVKNLNKFISTKTQKIPVAYVFPVELENVANKLRQHGIQVAQLESEKEYSGEEFIIEQFNRRQRRSFGAIPPTLVGQIKKTKKTFPTGSYAVQMDQKLAYLAFYMLEPEVRDGLAYLGLFEEYFTKHGAVGNVYPVFKVFNK